LEEQLAYFKKQSRHHHAEWLFLKTEMEREKEMCDKETQLHVENIIDFNNFDELVNWNSSLNNFIIEGRDMGQEWANVLISDITSVKIVADWFDH
jgi:hypothetical protein